MYEQFMLDRDAYYNAKPNWGHLHDLQPEDLMEEGGVTIDNCLQVGINAIKDLDKKKIFGNVTEYFGRSPLWNVFGGWKAK